MAKRGAMDIQFNWIFVLIAGAVILGFFVAVINSVSQSEDTQLTVDVLQHLDTILKNAQQASITGSESFRQIAMPNTEIKLICSDGLTAMQLGSQGIEQPLPVQVIFGPEKLQGDRLYSWTLNFDIPFRTQSFVNLATDDVLFVFLYDDIQGDMKPFFDGFPSNLSSLYKHYEFITDSRNAEALQGYDAVHFIALDTPPTAADLPGLSQASYVNIERDPGSPIISGYGKVTFYDYDDGRFTQAGEPLPYLSHALVYGALFAHDREMYACNLDKAFQRAEYVSAIMFGRVRDLEGYSPSCQPLYAVPRGIEEAYLQALEERQVDQLYTLGTRLNKANTDLTRGAGCPILY